LVAKIWVGADHGHEIARAAAAESSNQLWKQARGKSLRARVQFEIGFGSHLIHQAKSTAAASLTVLVWTASRTPIDRLSFVIGRLFHSRWHGIGGDKEYEIFFGRFLEAVFSSARQREDVTGPDRSRLNSAVCAFKAGDAGAAHEIKHMILCDMMMKPVFTHHQNPERRFAGAQRADNGGGRTTRRKRILLQDRLKLGD
jgi:hypothetical protein